MNADLTSGLESLLDGNTEIFRGLDLRDNRGVTVEVKREFGNWAMTAHWDDDRDFKILRCWSEAFCVADWINNHLKGVYSAELKSGSKETR